tara:strand:- start:2664 stop:3917 length:1254 start_codon:yes stop_codon:yes gene_type:complete
MNFEVNVAGLVDGSKMALDIATKGLVKDHQTGNLIAIKANKSNLEFTAHGGRLASCYSISDLDTDKLDYECKKGGEVVVNALHFNSAMQSFREDSRILIEAKKGEVKMSLIDDDNEYQTLTVADSKIVIPKEANEFEKEIKLDLQMFLHGSKKTIFAIGWKGERPVFLYWVLRVDKDKLRFLAGDGARFAALDIEGKSFFTSNGKYDLLFPKDQTSVVVAILERSKADNVIIKQAKRNDTDRTPDQIVIKFGDRKMFLVAFDPTLNYPNENKILNAQKPLRVFTKVDDWVYAARGMDATYTQEFKDEHETWPANLHVDIKNKQIIIKTDTPLKSRRQVPIESVTQNQNTVNGIDIRCAGAFFLDIPKYCDKNGDIEVCLASSTDPIVFRQPKDVNKSVGLTELYRIFFAVLGPENDD